MNGVGMVRRPEITCPTSSRRSNFTPVAAVPFDARIFGVAANNGQMIGEVDAGNRAAEIVYRTGAGRAWGGSNRSRGKKTLFEPFVARFARKGVVTAPLKFGW